MAASNSLDATLRAGIGTGETRALRRDGKVPGVVYGGKGETVSIAVERRLLNRALNVPGLVTQTIALTIDGKTETVKLQDVQLHPVTSEALHVDFLRTACPLR